MGVATKDHDFSSDLKFESFSLRYNGDMKHQHFFMGHPCLNAPEYCGLKDCFIECIIGQHMTRVTYLELEPWNLDIR